MKYNKELKWLIPLKKLNKISNTLDDMIFQINREEKVMEEELADRLRLGLEGDAAIAHYNAWNK